MFANLLLLPLLATSANPAPPPPTPDPKPEPEPLTWLRQQEVRPLSGGLNQIPVFNSNSPEIVREEGILLSTLPPIGKAHPEAHLNFAFEDRFDLFAHHIAKVDSPQDLRTLYLGIILHNSSTRPVRVEVLQGVSYLTHPEAPFANLQDWMKDSTGWVYAGPGSRVMSEILRGFTQEGLPQQVEVPPGESRMLLSLPIPSRGSSNARSTLVRLRSNGPIYMASLAMFGKSVYGDVGDLKSGLDEDEAGSLGRQPDRPALGTPDAEELEELPEANLRGPERSPTLEEWERLLQTSDLVNPRDLNPTPLAARVDQVIYGRVAGVARGSEWRAELTDPGRETLRIPARGSAFSYGISLLYNGTLGTRQIQSAEMLARYPDTAYQAHGNYGVEYNLTLPLVNPTDETQEVTVSLDTPLKEDRLSLPGLQFFRTPPERIFFRGAIRVAYPDDGGRSTSRYIHLVQRQGQVGDPLVQLEMPPGDRRSVQVNFLYPPDSTPPQVLTVQTLAEEVEAESEDNGLEREDDRPVQEENNLEQRGTGEP